jgi:hypothetical protein
MGRLSACARWVLQGRVHALIDQRVAVGDEVVVIDRGRVVAAVGASTDPLQGRAVAPATLF